MFSYTKNAHQKRSSHSHSFLLSTVFILALLLALFSTHIEANSLLIKNVKIISANVKETSTVTNVLIENNKITAIGNSINKVTQEYDGTGQFLIPGLIDSHVHLSEIPGYKFSKENHQAISTDSDIQIPKSYLYHGFTTLLDMVANTNIIAQWRKNDLAPDTFYCSPVFIPNGYPLSWQPKDQQFTEHTLPFMLFDKKQAHVYPSNFDKGEHTPEKLVQRINVSGAQCIKVFYEAGFGANKNLPLPSVEMITDLVNAAHKINLPVYLHGNSQQSYEFAMKTNIDMVVHGMWHWSSLTTSNEQGIDDFVSNFSQKKIAVQPTIQVIYGEQEIFDPNYLNKAANQHVMPQSLISWYQSEDGQWMMKKMKENLSIPDSLNTKETYQHAKLLYKETLNRLYTITKKLMKADAPIIFGTDTPSGPFYTQFPGLNGREEMYRWVEAGISLAELFNALTINNAKFLGLQDSIGSIELGKKANLLLLTKNPLVDVAAYDSITKVILNGKMIEREKLSATNAYNN